MSSRHPFEIFADYHQIYLMDDTGAEAVMEPLIWDDAMVSDRVALMEGLIAVSTARDMEVPLEIVLADAEPDLDLDAWDHVVTCCVALLSGRLVVMGCTDDISTAARLPLPPRTYRARVMFAGLGTLSEDGLDGDDRYRVELWPGAAGTLTVLKRHSGL